jgi:hypothetical protein
VVDCFALRFPQIVYREFCFSRETWIIHCAGRSNNHFYGFFPLIINTNGTAWLDLRGLGEFLCVLVLWRLLLQGSSFEFEFD